MTGGDVLPSPRMVEDALRMIATASVYPPELAQQAEVKLKDWAQRSPRHEAAVTEALRRWHSLAGMADGLKASFDERMLSAPAPAPALVSRRRLLSWAAGAGVSLLAAGGGWRFWSKASDAVDEFAQAYETGPGRMQRVDLPDGSRLDLSAGTAIQVRLLAGHRLVRLIHGELYCDVAPDHARPFEVETDEGTVRVLGTVFGVGDRQGSGVTVEVQRGSVQVMPTGGAAVVLGLGMASSMNQGRASAPRLIEVADVGAWRDGWLVFRDVPLRQALPAINAWRASRPLVAADEATAVLRLSGRFRAGDEASTLVGLQAALKLRVQNRKDGGVELSRW